MDGQGNNGHEQDYQPAARRAEPGQAGQIASTPEVKVYPTVDRVIALIKDSGIKYTVWPLETTMEDELDRLLAIVKEAQLACTAAGAARVLSVVKVDYGTRDVTIDEKVGQYRA
ncbi:MAG: thiamine-binding protein [Bacillota bacterium]